MPSIPPWQSAHPTHHQHSEHFNAGLPGHEDVPLSTFAYPQPSFVSPQEATSSSYSGGLSSSWVDNFPSGSLFTEPTPLPPNQASSMVMHDGIRSRPSGGLSLPTRKHSSTSTSSSPSNAAMGTNSGPYGMVSSVDEGARTARRVEPAMNAVYPSGLMHRGSFSAMSNASASSSSSLPLPLGHHFSAMNASALSVPSYFDAPMGMTMPPPNPPSEEPAAIEQETQKRATTACNFCRSRKLRCDGNAPCRQCARRDIDCVFAQPSASKRKKREDDGSGAGRGTRSPEERRAGRQSNSTGGDNTEEPGLSTKAHTRRPSGRQEESELPLIGQVTETQKAKKARAGVKGESDSHLPGYSLSAANETTSEAPIDWAVAGLSAERGEREGQWQDASLAAMTGSTPVKLTMLTPTLWKHRIDALVGPTDALLWTQSRQVHPHHQQFTPSLCPIPCHLFRPLARIHSARRPSDARETSACLPSPLLWCPIGGSVRPVQ